VNRETAAAVTATQTGILIFLVVALFAMVNDPGTGVAAGPPPFLDDPEAPVSPLVEEGWRIYQAERCSRCHSIEGTGSPRYPLDGTADRLDARELRLWVVAPQEMQPRVRKQPYDHLSEDEVDALVAFLQMLTGN
jgi:cbb3-type cytochrome oxidase cytochrome c subunit